MKKKLASLFLAFTLVLTSFGTSTTAYAAVSKDGRSYEVEKGDNLYRIGKKVKKDWKEIADLNSIKEPWTIFIGDILKLEAENAQIAPNDEKSEESKIVEAEQDNDNKNNNVTDSSKEADTKEKIDAAKKIEHGKIAFDEIVYERPDFEKMQNDIIQVDKMLENNKDAKIILDAYEQLGEGLFEVATALNYATIRTYLDVTDAFYATEVAVLTQANSVLQNQYIVLAEKILASHIGSEATELWGDDELEAIKRAKMLLNEEVIELNVKDKELQNLYINATSATTVDVKGKKLTLTEILSQPELTLEEQSKYYYEYIDALNVVAGDIYLQQVEVRNQIADSLGFDSYVDYIYYANQRDYTAGQAAELHEHIKDYIVPVYQDLVATLTQEDINYLNSTGGDITAFDAIYRKLFDEVSPDMQEAYDYMLDYKLYNFDFSPVKANLSYTAMMYNYHQPFMNINPTGIYRDISTFIHEFGHYNAFYKHDIELSSILDIVEIHSQGLETLFTPYYAVYGEAAESIVKYNFIVYLETLIQGCLEDEFQQYVYKNDVKSVKELNEIYYELQLDYGLIEESIEKESTSWVLITHTFVMPLYYISYATSLIPALEIFEISTVDREGAIKVYNDLVDMGTEETFLETLKAAGLGSPFYEGTINKISEAIGEYFNLFEEAVLDPAA